MKIAIPIAVLVVALVALVAGAIYAGQIPEVQVAQALEERPEGTFKMHGMIDSIESDHRPLRFTLRDKENPERTIPVEIDASRPDIFDVDKDVSVVVEWDSTKGILRGDTIYTKCPSKYEAAGEKVGDRTVPAYD